VLLLLVLVIGYVTYQLGVEKKPWVAGGGRPKKNTPGPLKGKTTQERARNASKLGCFSSAIKALHVHVQLTSSYRGAGPI
jgi:hypothetical protein